jgi:hypothetical protein
MKVLDLLLGRPLASDEAGGEQIGSLVGYQCSGGKTFHIFLEESSLARIPLEPSEIVTLFRYDVESRSEQYCE